MWRARPPLQGLVLLTSAPTCAMQWVLPLLPIQAFLNPYSYRYGWVGTFFHLFCLIIVIFSGCCVLDFGFPFSSLSWCSSHGAPSWAASLIGRIFYSCSKWCQCLHSAGWVQQAWEPLCLSNSSTRSRRLFRTAHVGGRKSNSHLLLLQKMSQKRRPCQNQTNLNPIERHLPNHKSLHLHNQTTSQAPHQVQGPPWGWTRRQAHPTSRPPSTSPSPPAVPPTTTLPTCLIWTASPPPPPTQLSSTTCNHLLGPWARILPGCSQLITSCLFLTCDLINCCQWNDHQLIRDRNFQDFLWDYQDYLPTFSETQAFNGKVPRTLATF